MALSRVRTTLMGRWDDGTRDAPYPLATKSNTRGSKITDSRARNYGSFKFVKFVLKIAPNWRSKFGTARKMLYLCIVITNGNVATREARHRVSNTMKNTFKDYGKDFV